MFWVAIVVGALTATCCLGSLAVLVLGGLVSNEIEVPRGGRAGGQWRAAGEVARSSTLTQPLTGRWVALYGMSLDTVISRSGDWATIRTDASGTAYELEFEDDGEYTFQYGSQVTLNGFTSRSMVIEKGEYELDGSTLTLTPASQRCSYESNGLKQDQPDKDLAVRRYQVVDIELETITQAGEPPMRFRGVELSGPAAKWDVSREQYELDLQRR
ncbi:MAG: hypothetical protein ACOZQL_07270 [Myxococcota bacterium]